MAGATLFDLLSIIWIDVILSGDNALIIGLAAASLSPELRRRAILFGLALATVIRIVFASVAVVLLQIPGLLFAGGLILVWISYSLFRDLRAMARRADASADGDAGAAAAPAAYGSFRKAMIAITLADISMSLDNVLAVAAIARDEVWLLVFGLALSIALMGIGASMVTRILQRYPFVSYVGLGFLLYVAILMLYDGWADIPLLAARLTRLF